MKKKNNTLLAVGLLVAVIGLGIGYAISTQSLTVEGTATAQESASSFNVKFKSATPTTAQTTTDDSDGILTSVVAKVDSDKKATMDVTLTNLNDEVTATFTIENASQAGLAAKVSADNVKVYKHGTTTDYTSEYFEVTPVVTTTTIPSVNDNTMTFNVKVKLKKAYVGEENSVTENFDVVLDNIEAIQE